MFGNGIAFCDETSAEFSMFDSRFSVVAGGLDASGAEILFHTIRSQETQGTEMKK